MSSFIISSWVLSPQEINVKVFLRGKKKVGLNNTYSMSSKAAVQWVNLKFKKTWRWKCETDNADEDFPAKDYHNNNCDDD